MERCHAWLARMAGISLRTMTTFVGVRPPQGDVPGGDGPREVRVVVLLDLGHSIDRPLVTGPQA